MALRALFAKSFRLVPGIHLQASMMSRNTCKPNELALHAIPWISTGANQKLIHVAGTVNLT